MLIWLILLVLLVIFRYRFPYFLKDLQYGVRTTRVGYRLAKYAQSKPYFTILDRFLETVSKHPQKTFISFKNESFSYQETDKQSNRVARALRERAGVQQGDTVALLLGNEPMFLWMWLALTKLGCSAALLNSNLRSRSLLHCFSCCGAKVLIAAAGTPPLLAVTLGQVRCDLERSDDKLSVKSLGVGWVTTIRRELCETG